MICSSFTHQLLLIVSLSSSLQLHSLSSFHNLHTSTLQHFPIGFVLLRTIYSIRCKSSCKRVFFGRIKPPKIVDTIHTLQNATQIIEMQSTNIGTNVLQRSTYLQDRCTIFKDHEINSSCLCLCCATMKLLLKMTLVILPRYTTNAMFIDFSLHALPLVCTGYIVNFAP